MEYAVKEMISRQDIAARVEEIAAELNADFAGREVVFVCILKGAAVFMADLMRHLKLDMSVEYLELVSYDFTESRGKVDMIKDFDNDISGKDVVIVEDIIDTGMTVNFIGEHLRAKNPASIKYCVLLDNPVRREADCTNPDYTGFVIPNQFVLGYGLDLDGKYRQLPFIGSLVKV
ncbi:MAG: hypoxanthine phosphoribosyltransferase [Clostridiales bacterium]|jgi:hypoxanthine phosphoribosyltransferase|nr:hypoxanthine phosphoribosyltransferase [Clostridiales bacterium]